MKQTILKPMLVAWAVLCVIISFIQTSFSNLFSAALAFPFEQIGLLLRALSLSGTAGNVISLIIYILISLLPLFIFLMLRKKRTLYPEDWLLPILSIVIFIVLYMMINPTHFTMLSVWIDEISSPKGVLGAMVYSILFGYIILRALRLFFASGTKHFERYMVIMLSILSFVFIYLAFGSCFTAMLQSISSLQEGNVGSEHLLTFSYASLLLQFIINALPYLLDVAVIFSALCLVDAMRQDRYSEETVSASKHLSRLCAISLSATVISNIVFNLIQLLFTQSLRVINTTVQIPFLSAVFVLAILLLTRFISESKQLKDDNNMFI